MQKIRKTLHHLFIPSDRNNFRAKALHPDFLTYYLGFALIFLLLSKNVIPLKNMLGIATDVKIQKLYELTNKERQKNGLHPLSYNEELAEAAKRKAKDMFSKNYWAHFSTEGRAPWDFIAETGYQYEYAGENLAKNFLFSQNVVEGWMNSPSHRENILRRDYADIGFAVVDGVLNGEPTTLVVQMFAKPANPQFIGLQQIGLPAKGTENSAYNPPINLLGVSINFTYFFIAFLVAVLVADLYVISKMRIVRLHSKNTFHILFLSFMFIGLFFFISKGSII